MQMGHGWLFETATEQPTSDLLLLQGAPVNAKDKDGGASIHVTAVLDERRIVHRAGAGGRRQGRVGKL